MELLLRKITGGNKKTRREFNRKFAILFEVEKKTRGGVYKIDLGLILHRYGGQFGIDFRAIHTGY